VALIKAHDNVAVNALVKDHPQVLAYRGKKGENLLHVCCGVQIGNGVGQRRASISTAKVLIDAGIDVDSVAFSEGDWKATPLWYAIGRGKNLALAAYLIERGATPEHCMWAAAYNDDAAAIKLLRDAGAKVDPIHEETPLLFAVKWGRFVAAKALLEYGADANYQDAAGKTALHYMVKKRSDSKYVQMFIAYGARLDLADRDGKTVKELASHMRDPKLRAVIEATS
jgi:ankyrin repeat protein